MDTPDPKPRKGLALGSAAIGAAAILGSLLAFSGGAGAQDAPELSEPATEAVVAETAGVQIDDAELIELDANMIELDAEFEAAFAAFDECFSNELGIDLDSTDEAAWEAVTDDALMAAEDTCGDLLPEDVFMASEAMDDGFVVEGAYDADFAAYDECVETELGINFESADEAAWEALTDDAWNAADEACEDQLPAEILEMDAAWEKYDDCLAANGIDFEDEIVAFDDLGEEVLVDDLGAHVFVEDGEAFSMAEFGEADGSITITQTDGTIEVLGDGDVEIIDFDDADLAEFEIDEEREAAHTACEGELPDDLMVFGEAELLEGDVEMFDLSDDMVEVPAEA